MASETSLFYIAYRRTVPHILKVPLQRLAMREQRFFSAVAPPSEVALVPLEVLRLEVDHSTGLGLLMPWFASTLAELPQPMDEDVAMLALQRLRVALDFLHERGWLHCDVKPGNVFVDSRGLVWLGDYGLGATRAEFSEAVAEQMCSAADGRSRYGTPAYQCVDQDYRSDPCALDRTGLVITVLELLGRVPAGFPHTSPPLTLPTVTELARGVASAQLRAALLALLRPAAAGKHASVAHRARRKRDRCRQCSQRFWKAVRRLWKRAD